MHYGIYSTNRNSVRVMIYSPLFSFGVRERLILLFSSFTSI